MLLGPLASEDVECQRPTDVIERQAKLLYFYLEPSSDGGSRNPQYRDYYSGHVWQSWNFKTCPFLIILFSTSVPTGCGVRIFSPKEEWNTSKHKDDYINGKSAAVAFLVDGI